MQRVSAELSHLPGGAKPADFHEPSQRTLDTQDAVAAVTRPASHNDNGPEFRAERTVVPVELGPVWSQRVTLR